MPFPFQKYYRSAYFKVKGSLRKDIFPTKPRFRSVPNVMVLNSQPLTELLIKCQRLPRGFFWNDVFPPLVYNIDKITEIKLPLLV